MASEQLRLMAVHAHPDDESSKGAATMARYADEGVAVRVVTCTGGERGSVLNPALQGRADVEANLPKIRRDEMARARSILGIGQRWLGFVDSGLPQGAPLPDGCFALQPVEEGIRRLVREVRDFRPHVMTTYDEIGGYPHPDHIRCHEVSVGAFEAAPDPSAYRDEGEPWQPLKLYYDAEFSADRLDALHKAMIGRGLESPFEQRNQRWEELRRLRPTKITTRIKVADRFVRRDEALLAHATQIDPNGWFFSVPIELQREVWPTEDFELARSLVDSNIPEDDLFAGIRHSVTP